MVYGAIDEKSRRYYTYLWDVFDAIGHRQREYNWLITDTEIMARHRELDALNTHTRWETVNGSPAPIPAPDFYFLSGEELTEIVSRENAQWIWGALSGFEKGIALEDIMKYPLPEADGYKGFWKNPVSLQHPLASAEIVAWDASLVLVLSKQKDLVDRFREAFPESRDLSEYNAESK